MDSIQTNGKIEMAQNRHQCCKRIYSGARWDIGGHPCARNATVQQDGRWWCSMHTPEAVARQEAAKDARWRAEREAEEAVRDAARALAQRLGGGQPDYDTFSRRYTGGVALTKAEAEALIARLEGGAK